MNQNHVVWQARVAQERQKLSKVSNDELIMLALSALLDKLVNNAVSIVDNLPPLVALEDELVYRANMPKYWSEVEAEGEE